MSKIKPGDGFALPGLQHQSKYRPGKRSATRFFLRRYLVNLAAARPHAVRGEQVKQPGHKRIVNVITFDNAFFPLIRYLQQRFKLPRIACCSAAKFFAPKRIKLCTATTERKPVIAHGAN